jgi:hypothetical protein
MFSGVDLPDLVGLIGPTVRGCTAATSRSRVQVGADKGTLQRAFTRENPVGVPVAHDDPDQSGPPGGMLTAQLYGDLNQLGIGSPRLMATAVVVAWGDPLGTAGAKAIH